MQRKYIQLLLSINFCLTAAVIAHADSDKNTISMPLEESFMEGVKDQFDQIWSCLEEINTIYQSQSLQEFISKNRNIKEIPYDENSEKIRRKKLVKNHTKLLESLNSFQKLPEQNLDEMSRNKLSVQKEKIKTCLAIITHYFQLIHQNANLKKERFFFINQCKKFQNLSLNEIIEDSINLQSFNSESEKFQREGGLISTPLADELPSIRIELDDRFNQIWNYLDKINEIHQSSLLQKLISDHREIEIPYDESLEEINQEDLTNLFTQLYKFLKICSQHQSRDEESGAISDIQFFNQITDCLNAINEIYNSQKESLSKSEKAFLVVQLAELYNFSSNFIVENCLQADELNPLDRIQALLDSNKKEDSLIYSQYEYILNSQEANVSDLLASSKTENTIENQFLHFNKPEGLIEIQHREFSKEGKHLQTYTTIWKIRPTDVDQVKDWKKQDPIDINHTGIFFQYTMFMEKLPYTLTNHKNSVRANFVCKSSKENTYTILSIDYLENIVILKNGPCLFAQNGDLEDWHIKDTVVLQRSGSVIDTNNSHELINTTRGSKRIRVYLKKQS